MTKTKNRDTIRASLIKKTAELTGFTERYVRNILNDGHKKENEASDLIHQTFKKIAEGENRLLKKVKQFVMLNNHKKIKK
jgi:hypothetical protein